MRKKHNYTIFYLIAILCIAGSFFLGKLVYNYVMTHETSAEKALDVLDEKAENLSKLTGFGDDEDEEEAGAPEAVVTETPAGEGRITILPQGDAMPEDYLQNCLFLGDSRTLGLADAGLLPAENVFAENGINPVDYLDTVWEVEQPEAAEEETAAEEAPAEEAAEEPAGKTIDQIAAERKPDRIYIALGVNGVGFMNTADMNEALTTLIERLLEASPDSDIIIQSVLPVNESTIGDDALTNGAITQYNIELMNLATQCNVYYLDASTAMVDEKGNLKAEYDAGDGLHFNADGNQTILTQILNHPVPEE